MNVIWWIASGKMEQPERYLDRRCNGGGQTGSIMHVIYPSSMQCFHLSSEILYRFGLLVLARFMKRSRNRVDLVGDSN